ncbi:beta-galactosidase [Sphingomonas hengshuiensis]|uniref:Beta-galactosidase n=1 Tax=Sphingomonas hengshuiensis TaxID=1609977 RepID=A0A7U5BEY7_9SPHN|nr:beta-galactosidase [Sphingomonas hengshuiensis]AJP74023.1 beta-galactosidase [Sphingomonas hengshuiensis]
MVQRSFGLFATIALAALALAPPAAAQREAAEAALAAPKVPLAIGVAWYPEQWPEARWATDLALMQKAGFNTVRLAEFAWSRMEPSEGAFDFVWLDRAIAAAHAAGMQVVLGTPTAAPPAWMSQLYPDILRVDENGTRAEHGGRRHFSFASARYRGFATRIAREMARRYGRDARVIGWQIDNEVGPPSFDAEAQVLWHAFLKQRYGTIDTLNRRWTTQYWSQHYDNFEQVPLRAGGQHNPGLLLDFKHFTTATWTDYVQAQARAIRAVADPRQWVTTNTMFWNAGFDHYAMHRDLDLASWDNYIPDGRPDWLANGANHDLVRGYKQRNFWLMETQPGRVDWVPVNRALDRGQTREMAWQAIGHGADAVLYWQWRSALNGQEQYHGAMLGPDGTPFPIYDEIAQVARDAAAAAPALAGTAPVGRIAMLFSYDSRWAIDLQRHHRDFDPVKQFTAWYRPLRSIAQGVAVLPVDADLARYPLVVAPSLHVVTQAQADRLAAYVRGGGHLVLGPRSGMKDDANALWPQRQPGPLAELLGARVEQYYALDAAAPLTGSLGAGETAIWAETLVPEAKDVEILERYGPSNGWLDGKPAAVTRRVGKGRITYVGVWPDEAMLRGFAQRLLDAAGVAPVVPDAPPALEVMERAGNGRRALVLINHGATPLRPALPAGAVPVTGDLRDGVLPAHGVAVVALTPAQAGISNR